MLDSCNPVPLPISIEKGLRVLPRYTIFRILQVFTIINLKIQLGFIVGFTVGINFSYRLFSCYFFAYTNTYLSKVSVNCTVISVLNNNCIIATRSEENRCNYTFEYRTGCATSRSLNVNSFIVGSNKFQNRMRLYPKMSTNKSIGCRPRQTPNIPLKISRKQCFFFGKSWNRLRWRSSVWTCRGIWWLRRSWSLFYSCVWLILGC